MNIILQSDIFKKWFLKIKDKTAKALITRRLQRMSLNNFGDCKSVGSGVYELRVNTGKGYRIYYAQEGEITYLILSGGDKSTQDKDIKLAIKMWNEYKSNKEK